MHWVATPVTIGVLVVSLSACRDNPTSTSPAAPAATAAPAVSHSSITSSVPPATATLTGSVAAAASNSAALAQVNADLSSINAGARQAGTDLDAGDSSRTQPDDGN